MLLFSLPSFDIGFHKLIHVLLDVIIMRLISAIFVKSYCNRISEEQYIHDLMFSMKLVQHARHLFIGFLTYFIFTFSYKE